MPCNIIPINDVREGYISNNLKVIVKFAWKGTLSNLQVYFEFTMSLVFFFFPFCIYWALTSVAVTDDPGHIDTTAIQYSNFTNSGENYSPHWGSECTIFQRAQHLFYFQPGITALSIEFHSPLLPLNNISVIMFKRSKNYCRLGHAIIKTDHT